MGQGWTCFVCGRVNEVTERYCRCGAARPRMANDFAAWTGDNNQESAVVSSAQESQEMVVQTSMLTGLADLVRQAASGSLSPSAFAEKMRTAAKQLDSVFLSIARDLDNTPSDEDDQEYVEAVKTALKDAAALFQIALAQLQRFGSSQNVRDLRVGMMIAERAEEAYQATEEELNRDARGYNLSGATDIVRRLAGEVVVGNLTLDEYRQTLDQVEKASGLWLQRGEAKLKSAFAAARAFSGRGVGLSQEAGTLLEEAAQALANVILAVHTQEEAERVAQG